MAEFSEEWLTAYLDDELEPHQRVIVEQKIAADPAMRQLFDELSRVRDLVTKLPPAVLSRNLSQDVLTRGEQILLGWQADDAHLAVTSFALTEPDNTTASDVARPVNILADNIISNSKTKRDTENRESNRVILNQPSPISPDKYQIRKRRQTWLAVAASLAASLLLMIYLFDRGTQMVTLNDAASPLGNSAPGQRTETLRAKKESDSDPQSVQESTLEITANKSQPTSPTADFSPNQPDNMIFPESMSTASDSIKSYDSANAALAIESPADAEIITPAPSSRSIPSPARSSTGSAVQQPSSPMDPAANGAASGTLAPLSEKFFDSANQSANMNAADTMPTAPMIALEASIPGSDNLPSFVYQHDAILDNTMSMRQQAAGEASFPDSTAARSRFATGEVSDQDVLTIKVSSVEHWMSIQRTLMNRWNFVPSNSNNGQEETLAIQLTMPAELWKSLRIWLRSSPQSPVVQDSPIGPMTDINTLRASLPAPGVPPSPIDSPHAPDSLWIKVELNAFIEP